MIKQYYNNYKRNIFIKCIGCIIITTLIILLIYTIGNIEEGEIAKRTLCVILSIPVLLILSLISMYCIQFWNVRRYVKAQDYQFIQRNGTSYLQIPGMCICIDECGQVIILNDYWQE